MDENLHLNDQELAEKLVRAAKANDLTEVIKWLEFAASPNTEADIDGVKRSAIDWAIVNENVEMMHLMRSCGAAETPKYLQALKRLDSETWQELMELRGHHEAPGKG